MYLSQHPNLFLPAQKETEFFYRDDRFQRGGDWYLETYFSSAKESQILGEVCPQYMFSEAVPERIHRIFPCTKIVFILRDPVSRAYSHYRMSVRRGRETRSFERVLDDELKVGAVCDRSREPDYGYVHFGEYGRIVGAYMKVFPSHQMRVVFTEDFVLDQRAVTLDMIAWLGADPGLLPDRALEKTYNVGGERRFRAVDRLIRGGRFVKRTARAVLGESKYNRLWLWWELEATVARSRGAGIDPAQSDRLQRHYSRDVACLEQLLGRRTPWARFHGGELSGQSEGRSR
ncbi:MAG: hypothetical protein EPO25_01375 [Gammaproteobacteria bacterium]|nr:MAG: hypothetical protein EPO25_01375 [Gammaproteobacteria bacterium]